MSPDSIARPPRRVLLIVNPGARRAARVSRRALAEFSKLGVSCDVTFTTAPGHATELARQRGADVDAVFTVGGDGTAMEAITALADGGPPVGILPGGTGNLLVRSLGIPLNIRRAVRALVEGGETRIDLGRLGDGRHFAIGLGVGLDEAMIAGATRVMKRHTGILAYFWTGFLATIRMQRFDVRLTVDGVVHEHRASSVLVANSGSMLGGLLKLNEGQLDDGLLHASIFLPERFADAFRIFVAMLRGTAHLDRCTVTLSGRHFLLETQPPRRAQADGELLDITPVEITVRPLAGRVLVPKRAERS